MVAPQFTIKVTLEGEKTLTSCPVGLKPPPNIGKMVNGAVYDVIENNLYHYALLNI